MGFNLPRGSSFKLFPNVGGDGFRFEGAGAFAPGQDSGGDFLDAGGDEGEDERAVILLLDVLLLAPDSLADVEIRFP